MSLIQPGENYAPLSKASLRMIVESQEGGIQACGHRNDGDLLGDTNLYRQMTYTYNYILTGWTGTRTVDSQNDTAVRPEGGSCVYDTNTSYSPPFSDPHWPSALSAGPTSTDYDGSMPWSAGDLISSAQAAASETGWESETPKGYGGNDLVYPTVALGDLECYSIINDTSAPGVAAGFGMVRNLRVRLERVLDGEGADILTMAPIKLLWIVTRDNGYGSGTSSSDTDPLGEMILGGGEMESDWIDLIAPDEQRVILSDPLTLVGRWFDKTRADVLGT